MIVDNDAGRARLYLQPYSLAIIAAAAGRRQGHAGFLSSPALARAGGDRAPLSLAARPVSLQTITERLGDGRAERVTPLDYRTAVRSGPRFLAALDRADPRRRAADIVADAFERVGSVKGADLQGSDTKGGISDGGATTRIKHAARLRLIEAVANGWPVGRAHGDIVRGAPRVAMPTLRQRGARKEIRAFDALIAAYVEGQDLAAILSAHGWSVHSKHTRALADALLQVLGDISDAVWGAGVGARAGLDA